MTTFDAILLGIIQGLTEFLPVSSSGHLELAQTFLGLENLERYILFDVVCHVGTLLSIFCVFAPQIRETFVRDRGRLLQVGIALLPLFLLLPFMGPIKSLFNQTQYLGFFFFVTAFLLFVGTRFAREKPPEEIQKNRWKDAIIIGFFQLLAIFPGVSRSGSTISCAWLRGWSRQEAVSFSFLLAIPTVLGATAFELFELTHFSGYIPNVSLGAYVAGFITSFIVGYVALKLLIKLALNQRFGYFMWYCIALGIFTTLYFNR